MGKLITESDVRKLVKDGKISKHQVFFLPRGTILTPSARGFLIDHQVKINKGNSKLNGNKVVINRQRTFTSSLATPNIDFENLESLQVPMLELKNRLKEQTITLIKIISLSENYDEKPKVIQSIIEFINGILVGDFYRYDTNKSLEKIKISSIKLNVLTDEIMCLLNQLQVLIVDIAISLRAIKTFYPDLNSLDSYKDIVSWQEEVQKWISDVLSIDNN
ncbi:hypothetical protein H5S09_06070 [Limosilactobacillus sp. STM2_1]|uniref:Uncharacterized protein n=1 Tax=Limosilactobacillus rudii TaxID=2759755 RepID=A0A7W3YNN8_9LACO|nr:hypothetical protein [Limosilactobacillus rudii]MBB1079456.1 hypothetical protein [Limosilactobacillus rudii]MBB1097502.1 hypothetical protein [Limosilactobacillus rudii]MCD7134612.1 hypothetical protein [Limosilactobacillus rudii]